MSQPRFLYDDHLAYPFQTTHLVDKQLHNNNSRHRKKNGVIFDLINFEDDKPLTEQVKLLVGVKQKIIFSTTVIRLQHVQEPRKVEILFPDFFLFQYPPVVRFHELVEGVERGNDAFILLDAPDIQGHRIGQSHFFRTCRRFIVLFPECED